VAGRFRDISGMKFGRLTAICQTASKKTSNGAMAQWVCRCECGNEVVRTTSALFHKKTPSCGCWHHEWTRKHGHSFDASGRRSPTYMTWQNMIGRCTNPKATGYEHYRSLGVTVCDRWRKFENFLADMGDRPIGTTLDRIDNKGSYEPGNCRWATKTTQANNRRTNLHFVYKGVSYTLAELARATSRDKDTLRARLVRPGGWSVDEAVETPIIPRHLRRAGLSKR
jgi:hypothetical protein